MRLVFWLFLAINVAFFYWQFSQPEKVEEPVLLTERLPDGVERLVLLRERGLGVEAGPTSAQPAAADGVKGEVDTTTSAVTTPAKVSPEPLPQEEAPPKPPLACFTLGPFKDESAAGRVYKALRKLEVKPEHRVTERRVGRGYWVYLPPYKTYSAARKKVDELKKKGLDDMYIMGKGAMKNAVSLGLFKRKSTATERFEEVRRLDPAVVMKPQYRTLRERWLDLKVAEDAADVIAGIRALAESREPVQLERRDPCE